GGVDLAPVVDLFAEGTIVETGELVPATEILASLGTVPGLGRLLTALGIDEGAETPHLPPPVWSSPSKGSTYFAGCRRKPSRTASSTDPADDAASTVRRMARRRRSARPAVRRQRRDRRDRRQRPGRVVAGR